MTVRDFTNVFHRNTKIGINEPIQYKNFYGSHRMFTGMIDDIPNKYSEREILVVRNENDIIIIDLI